jgi:hypothetical protein
VPSRARADLFGRLDRRGWLLAGLGVGEELAVDGVGDPVLEAAHGFQVRLAGAAAPALFMGLGDLLLVGFGSSVHEVLNWLWPPALLALVIWMIVRAHRQLRSRSRRWLLYPVIAMLALASIGGGYETVREAADAKAYPMPGQLIDVGGHSLHLNRTGSGSPTVVLEPGGGEMSSNLGWITPAVARDTRVCVYDRAGRGWSEPADTPRTARR